MDSSIAGERPACMIFLWLKKVSCRKLIVLDGPYIPTVEVKESEVTKIIPKTR